MSKIQKINKFLEPIFSKINLSKYFSRYFFVFTYHEVSDNPSKFCSINNLNVKPEIFDRQLAYIKKYFDVVSPENIGELSSRVQKPQALITFDDGFRGAVNIGAKIMNDHGLYGINFVNANPICNNKFCYSAASNFLSLYDKGFSKYISTVRNSKKTNFYQISKHEIDGYLVDRQSYIEEIKNFHGPFATLEDLSEAAKFNLFVGNHLFDHINALTLDHPSLIFQYQENERQLGTLKNYLKLFSYPFGQPITCYDDSTTQLIKSCGAKKLFSANQKFTKLSDDVMHRIPMYDFVITEQNFKTHCIVPSLLNCIR